MLSIQQRISAIEQRLSQAQMHYELGVANGSLRSPERVEALFEKIERDVTTIGELVKPKVKIRALSEIERITSVIDAAAALAQTRGNILYRPDAFLQNIAGLMPADAAAYWLDIGEHKLAGHVAYVPEIAEALKSREVLVWRSVADGLIRLVDANWLTARASIRTHVVTRLYGRRCRFCRIPESQTSMELVPVDPEARSKFDIHNGTVQLSTKQVHVHLQCLPYWEQWVAIAESYPTQEAAEAADREAGRTAQELPALPDLESQAGKGDEPQHFSSKEQGR